MFKVLVLVILGSSPVPTDENFFIIEQHRAYESFEACEAVKENVLVDTLKEEGIVSAYVSVVCTELSVPEFADKEFGIPMIRGDEKPNPYPPPVI